MGGSLARALRASGFCDRFIGYGPREPSLRRGVELGVIDEYTLDLGEALAAAEKLGTWPVVVKAQIHAGGRGKGGGVILAKNKKEVKAAATGILGMTLITHQTSPEGRLVKKVLVEQRLNIQKELYLQGYYQNMNV